MLRPDWSELTTCSGWVSQSKVDSSNSNKLEFQIYAREIIYEKLLFKSRAHGTSLEKNILLQLTIKSFYCLLKPPAVESMWCFIELTRFLQSKNEWIVEEVWPVCPELVCSNWPSSGPWQVSWRPLKYLKLEDGHMDPTLSTRLLTTEPIVAITVQEAPKRNPIQTLIWTNTAQRQCLNGNWCFPKWLDPWKPVLSLKLHRWDPSTWRVH